MHVFSVSASKTTLSIFVKRRNFRLSVSPGSGEALVRSGGKIKYHLTAYFLATFLPKTIKIG